MTGKFLKVFVFSFIVLLILGVMTTGSSYAVRLKDLASIKGVRSNQLIGYGLVIGLNGTGDKSGAGFTVQALVNMMEKMGVHLNRNQIKVKNVAAVVVTSDLPPFARIGSRIDIIVSSIGDAKSLVGGTLLITQLRGVNGKVYALAQGSVSVGGVGAEGAAGGVTKNHLLVARIPGGGSVENEVPMPLSGKENLTIVLSNPDFTTVDRITGVINKKFGKKIAQALDSGTLNLNIPVNMRGNVPMFIASIERLEVKPDMVARIVINEKTGTVVIGENVKISKVAVSHGNLSISINESFDVSQPKPLSKGETIVTPRTDIQIDEQGHKVMIVSSGATISDLVRALNAIGVTPRDMITIFQSIKACGALQAELEII